MSDPEATKQTIDSFLSKVEEKTCHRASQDINADDDGVVLEWRVGCVDNDRFGAGDQPWLSLRNHYLQDQATSQ